jgi:uncharacterized membrane protein YhiD involved in acid resistance
MLQNLQGIDLFAPTLFQTFLNLLVGFAASFIISLVYRFTYRGPGYSNGFVISIITLSMIVTLVIMIIGNNLARAFGLVGALSIIRFRTAVKDTIDIVYLFFALAIGMAAGVGYYKLVISGTVMISVVLMIFSKTNIDIFRGEQFLLQMRYADDDVSAVKNLLNEFCSRFELINVKSSAEVAHKEFSYYVNLKRKKDYLDFVKELRSIKAVEYVNLFRDDEHI